MQRGARNRILRDEVDSDRVEQQARGDRKNPALLLGHVMAHELGHLLLRRAAHSLGGLMRASLDVERAGRGVLLFTDAEEEAIRASLSASAGRL